MIQDIFDWSYLTVLKVTDIYVASQALIAKPFVWIIVFDFLQLHKNVLLAPKKELSLEGRCDLLNVIQWMPDEVGAWIYVFWFPILIPGGS